MILGALDAAEDINLTNLSLSRVVYLLRWKSQCLSPSMAAFIMLRRRGIPAVMITGVKFGKDSSLHAHAWVDTSHVEPGSSVRNSEFAAVVRIGQSRPLAAWVFALLSVPLGHRLFSGSGWHRFDSGTLCRNSLTGSEVVSGIAAVLNIGWLSVLGPRSSGWRTY